MKKTLLALGAHYDDCVYGISGILLQAVRMDYRVVVLNLIGDYTNWPPVKGREAELIQFSQKLAHDNGVEMQFLTYASGQFLMNEQTIRTTAKIVEEVQPDIAFMLWHQDHHPDHENAAAISKIALRQAGSVLDDARVKVPRIYLYENGPGHVIGFEPNIFVDVSEDWNSALAWLGELKAFVTKRTYDPMHLDSAQTTKAALGRYRGASCGARSAEALRALYSRPTQIL